LCEFRSRQLVGLAAMDLNQRDLILCQHGDNQTYATTAMWLHHFLPREATIQMSGTGLARAAEASDRHSAASWWFRAERDLFRFCCFCRPSARQDD